MVKLMENIEQQNTYIKIVKLILRAFKFGLYVGISFLELILKALKVLFNLTEYKPLQSLTESKNNFLNNIAAKEINKYKIKFAAEKLTQHTYEFERSELFSSTYKYLQEKLKDFADNNVTINQDIYKDILNKIDILTVEADRKALQEGYKYAKVSKYKLQDNEVYSDFIQYKIMGGEGHGKVNQEYRTSTD